MPKQWLAMDKTKPAPACMCDGTSAMSFVHRERERSQLQRVHNNNVGLSLQASLPVRVISVTVMLCSMSIDWLRSQPRCCRTVQVHRAGAGHGAVAAVSHTHLQGLQDVRVRTPQRNSSCSNVRCSLQRHAQATPWRVLAVQRCGTAGWELVAARRR